MKNYKLLAIILIILGIVLGYYAYGSTARPYKLGLDLNGGTHLVYQADVSKVDTQDVGASMQALRDVIENRINVFGVSEPLVQTEQSNINGQKVEKLIVELPGVTDIDKAVAMIGQTPVLDFRVATTTASIATTTAPTTTKTTTASSSDSSSTLNLFADASSTAAAGVSFIPTQLTGRFITRAILDMNPTTNQPEVTLQFNSEGKKLFADLTKANVGNVIGIFLDGRPISTPVVREPILDGQAQISGNFTIKEAQDLVRNLNYGALPVPITLIGSQTIGASLGADALHKSMQAGLIGFAVIAIFLMLWYRLPGLVASVALVLYVAFNLAIYKFLPVTMTSAGLAAFVLSIGMAVDANILIFERMKEELHAGSALPEAIRDGFSRAWTSIRDGNLSSIITAIILFAFATTSIIKGFALVFLIGVLVSMFTAVTASRSFLLIIAPKSKEASEKPLVKFLFGSGFHFKKK